MPDDVDTSQDTSSGDSGSSGIAQRIAKGLGGMSRSSNDSAQKSRDSADQSIEDVGRAAEGFRNTAAQRLGSFKKGGKVKRTGTYKLHAGEEVLTKRQAKRMKSKRA
jgi:hypothetical protein